ncbi:MAG: sigma-70 family RNA polymerase sigma factor [Bacteroidota bacterium]
MSFPDDTSLVAACCKQNREAQQVLYMRFRTPLYRMCLRYARDPQEAEDFLHDGMLKVFADIGQFRGTGALGGWVRRVVLNVVLQHIRKRPHWLSEEHIPEKEIPSAPDLDEQLQTLQGSQIFALVKKLPIGYRTVFSLYYLEQRGHKEIASLLGISEGASKSQLYKARRALKQAIMEHFPTYQYRS